MTAQIQKPRQVDMKSLSKAIPRHQVTLPADGQGALWTPSKRAKATKAKPKKK